MRHARVYEMLYSGLESLFLRMDPLFRKVGYNRLEKPVAWFERHAKGLLFDCQMCGQCILSSTGMSCPMNCPKNLRNGPCGGVRDGGYCEACANRTLEYVAGVFARGDAKVVPPEQEQPQ